MSAEEALERDFEIVAQMEGFTLAEVRKIYKASEALARVADRLAKARPNVFVGSVAPRTPNDLPTLLVKGPAGQEVRELVSQEGQVPIRISDQHPYSYEELEARQHKVHSAVVEMGYQNVGTFADPDGRIQLSIGHEPGLASVAEEIIPELPEALGEETTVTFTEADAFQNESLYAGLSMWQTVVPTTLTACTTGFSVTLSGTPLFLTAGHCFLQYGIAAVVEDNSNRIPADLYGFYVHIGDYGDFALYTASATLEPRFYADPDAPPSWQIRDVNSVRTTPVSTGTFVCFYSRGMAERNCRYVAQSGVECTIQGFTARQNVVMESGISTEGDSGGPWTVGTRAYGVHRGRCNNGSLSTYTPIRTILDWDSSIQVTLAN